MSIIKRILLLSFLLLSVLPFSILYAKDNPDDKGKDDIDNIFANQSLLYPLFEKLYELETKKEGKINIVHIGDSHIQADFFTNTIREALQAEFGNGGFGFTFPYGLIRTNGPRCVKYVSNATWQSQLNVSPIADIGVGLSGIALYTPLQNFLLQLTVNEGYEFNTIKIIYPTIEPQYKISVTAGPMQVTASGGGSSSTGFVYHKVKSGESLSVIGRKHKVTVNQIKSANGLKSNMIRPNQRLKIPVKGKIIQPKVENTNVVVDSLDCVTINSAPYFSSYTSDTLLNKVTILPAEKQAMYNLNGFIIENNQSGIVYHSIGVNGARMVDYAKYSLFFEQLPILQPDLIILSFGTNESFARMSDTDYVYQLNEFVKNIQERNKDAVILVMTPPPSMLRRTRVNTYVSSYSTALMGLSHLPVWDLYTRMGGASGIAPRGQYAKMMDRRRIHYTVSGYQAQGELFMSDFMSAYNHFKNNYKTK